MLKNVSNNWNIKVKENLQIFMLKMHKSSFSFELHSKIGVSQVAEIL